MGCNHGTKFLSYLIVSAVLLGRTFALWLAGFSNVPIMSTNLGAGAFVRSNSITCSANMDIKVTLCPNMIIILFEVVFLPHRAFKFFIQRSLIIFR